MRKQLPVWIANAIFNYQKLWLAVIAGLTIFFAYNLQFVRIDNTVEALFQQDSATVEAFHIYTEKFGNAELAVVAFKDEKGIFRPESLQRIDAMTKRLESEVQHVESVVSLTNIQLVDRAPDGGLAVRPLIDLSNGSAPDEAALQMAFERAKSERHMRKTLISDDGKTTSIIIRSLYLENNSTFRQELTRDIRKIVDDFKTESGHTTHLGGPPVFLTYFDEFIIRDLVIFTPLVVLALGVLLFITFRSAVGVILPLGVVLLGSIWTVGLMGFLGYPISLATTIVPPLLLVTGIEEAIYVLSFFQQEASIAKPGQNAAYETCLKSNIACFLTSFTNCIGFGSLAITDILAVSQTGVAAGCGAMFIWVMNNVLMLIILQWIPYSNKQAEVQERLDHGLLSRILEKIRLITLNHTWTVFILGFVSLAAFIPGMRLLKVETNFINYFHESSAIVQAHHFLQDNLSGVAPMEILVDSKRPDGIKDPAVLAEMKKIEDDLAEDAAVDWAFSTADFVLLLHRALTDATEGPGFPVTDPAVIGQYLFLYQISGGSGAEDFISQDGQYGRISARLRDESTSVLQNTIARAEKNFEEAKSGATFTFADNTRLLVGVVDSMLSGTNKSSTLAMIVTFIMMWMYLGSFLLAGLFMIPNVIPILVVMGFMGYSGIEMTISTMMVGSVALGLAVDNTIHIFAHFPASLAHAKGDLDVASKEMMRTVGRACVSSAVSLLAGFMVLTLSEFYPNFWFGWLSVFTLCVSLVCNLTISFTVWYILGKRGYKPPQHMIDMAEGKH